LEFNDDLSDAGLELARMSSSLSSSKRQRDSGNKKEPVVSSMTLTRGQNVEPGVSTIMNMTSVSSPVLKPG